MVVVEHRKPLGVTLRQAYFPDRRELDTLVVGMSARTMLRVRHSNVVASAHPWLVQRSPCSTGLIDLTRGADSILGRMSRTTRRLVQRAAALGERITITCNDPASLPVYRRLHNTFVRHSGHATPMSERELAEWMRVADLFMLYLDGRPLIGHINVPDRGIGRVAGQFEASARQQLSPEEASVVGMCNRYLYWAEMKHYIGLGLTWYDVGGLRGQDDPITQFKLSLGATRIEEQFYTFAGPAIRLALRVNRAPFIPGLHRFARA